MNFFDMMKEVNDFTHTENGAGAYRSTGNAVLDAFGSLGGMTCLYYYYQRNLSN